MSNFSPVSSMAAPVAAILNRDSESGVRLMQTAIFTAQLPCEKIHIKCRWEEGGEEGRKSAFQGDRQVGMNHSRTRDRVRTRLACARAFITSIFASSYVAHFIRNGDSRVTDNP